MRENQLGSQKDEGSVQKCQKLENGWLGTRVNDPKLLEIDVCSLGNVS